MEVRETVFKRKAGKSRGKWTVRINYNGKTVERIFPTRAKATEARERMLKDIRETHGQTLKSEKMTFNALADSCEKRFYQPATIEDGHKTSGVKSYAPIQSHIKALRSYFGEMRLVDITADTVKAYRAKRKSRDGVKPATINRDLEVMRHMMYDVLPANIVKDIFKRVIVKTAEKARVRVLSEDEEIGLLEACSGERVITYKRKRLGKTEAIQAKAKVRSPYLKAIVMLAIDSAMRRGEILKLRWDDINFRTNRIRILSSNTKTEKPRNVPLTDRAKIELLAIRENSSESLPFPITDFKNAWTAAKKAAGIDDLRFHDLRSTAISRWLNKYRLPLSAVSKLAGHEDIKTTNRFYTVVDDETIDCFAEAMNSRHVANSHPLNANASEAFVN